MNISHYTYRVTWSQEDGEHVGLCAEFPFCHGLRLRLRRRLPVSVALLVRLWSTCKPLESPSQMHWPKNNTAGALWFASLRSYIAHLPSKRPSKA